MALPKNNEGYIQWLLERRSSTNPSPRTPYYDLGSPIILATDALTVTLAQVNAGRVVIPEYAQQQIKIINFSLRVNGGNFGGLTSILLQDTNSSPITIATFAVAQLTNGAILVPGSTGVTLGAGFVDHLTLGKGVRIIKSGSDGTVATGVTLTVEYKYASN